MHLCQSLKIKCKINASDKINDVITSQTNIYKKRKHKKREGRLSENKNLTYEYNTVSCPVLKASEI